MTLRPAVALDAPRLAQIEEAQPMSAHWGEKGLAGEIIHPFAQVWCAEENGEVLGFLALRLAAGFCEILNLAVCPQACRRGIGFLLLSRAFAEVRARGGQTVTLEVNVRNIPAISLYQKAGLKETGRREKFYNDTDDALIMGAEL